MVLLIKLCGKNAGWVNLFEPIIVFKPVEFNPVRFDCICFYGEQDKIKRTAIQILKMPDCALIGVLAITRLNKVCTVVELDTGIKVKRKY